MKVNEITETQNLDEAVPVVAAAVWIIKWAARYGAWPVLKWLLRKHGGKIAGGAAAVARGPLRDPVPAEALISVLFCTYRNGTMYENQNHASNADVRREEKRN